MMIHYNKIVSIQLGSHAQPYLTEEYSRNSYQIPAEKGSDWLLELDRELYRPGHRQYRHPILFIKIRAKKTKQKKTDGLPKMPFLWIQQLPDHRR